jgi:hypothetical protein
MSITPLVALFNTLLVRVCTTSHANVPQSSLRSEDEFAACF